MPRAAIAIPPSIEERFEKERERSLYRGHKPGRLYPRRGVAAPLWLSYCNKCGATLTLLEIPATGTIEVGGKAATEKCYDTL